MLNSFIPELQFKDTEIAIKSKIIDLLAQLKSFKFTATLVLVFKKIEKEYKAKYDTFYQNLTGSGRIIHSVTNYNVSISKYNPLAGSSYIKLTKELDHV